MYLSCCLTDRACVMAGSVTHRSQQDVFKKYAQLHIYAGQKVGKITKTQVSKNLLLFLILSMQKGWIIIAATPGADKLTAEKGLQRRAK